MRRGGGSRLLLLPPCFVFRLGPLSPLPLLPSLALSAERPPLLFLSLPLFPVLLTLNLSPSLPLSPCYPPCTMTLPSLCGPP